jgi:membrane protein DedA with SNARE-associated domain
MATQLPGVFHQFAPVLDHYGYAALAILVGLEGVGIPLPGQLVLVAGGIYAGAGQLSMVAVLTVGWLAAILGDNAGYAIGRFGGRRLVLRFGRRVGLTKDRLAATERFFARRGNLVVPAARFVDGLRQANGIAAGLADMGWWRFLAGNVLGATAWVGLWVSAGYFAGNHIAALYQGFQRYQNYLLAAVAAVGVAAVLRWAVKRRSGDKATA